MASILPHVVPRSRSAVIVFAIIALLIILSAFQTAHRPGFSPFSPSKSADQGLMAEELPVDMQLAPLPPSPVEIGKANHSTILVVPFRTGQSVSWFDSQLPNMPKALYEINRDDAPYRIPMDKGHEVMAYLTYIVDYWKELADTVVFIRPEQLSEINNQALNGDLGETIRRLSLDRVVRLGYMNLRCDSSPTCPDWLHTNRPAADLDHELKPEERYLDASTWEKLFPGETMPFSLSAPAGSQFAVSREQIQRRSRADYLRIRKWMMDDPIDSDSASRLFTYLWQYIFTGHGNVCPAESACYCDGYGLCFGGETKMKSWAAQYQQRIDLLSSLTSGNDTSKETPTKMRELTSWLNKYRAAAVAAGEKKSNRKFEAETIKTTDFDDNVGSRPRS